MGGPRCPILTSEMPAQEACGSQDCFSCQRPFDRGQGGLAFSEKVFTPLGVCCSSLDQQRVPGSLFGASLLRPWIHELVPPVSLQSFLEQRRFNAFLRFTQFLVTQEKTLVTNTAVLSSVCCGRCCPDVWNEGWVQPGQRMQQILQRLSGSLLQMQPNEGNSVLTAREQFFFITELALGKTSLLSASHLASS